MCSANTNKKGEATAMEMSFDCLDDFQDPPGEKVYFNTFSYLSAVLLHITGFIYNF